MTALVAGAIIALVAANIYLYVQVDHLRTDLAKTHDALMSELSNIRDASSVNTASQTRHIETLKEELEAARFLAQVTEATAAPRRLTEADAQAYQQERSTRAEIDWVRGAYVALFPVDPEARRAELETLRRELHLDDPESTTRAAMRPRTNKADLLSLLEYIAKQSAEAEKNTDPLPATKPIELKWKSATPELELSFAFPRTTLQ